MSRVSFAGSLLLFTTVVVTSGAATTGLWRDVDEGSIGARVEERQIVPQRYRTLALDSGALAVILAQAPGEGAAPGAAPPVVLELPIPDGGCGRFAIVDSPVMEPRLAARYPELRTYRGQGLDDPAATMRCDWTPAGFHAMILAPSGAVYVDPYRTGDTSHYISYFKRDAGPDRHHGFSCAYAEVNGLATGTPVRTTPERLESRAASGSELRTYRAAVAATGEYTAFFGGTVAAGLAAIVTAMNRINGIYEREVAVHMNLVADNDLIVYTNPVTDPYTNDDGFAMLAQNQSTLDAVIGDANYDVGHVFSTGGGGVAYLQVPCVSGWKARGVTGSSYPVGDSFWVDYVAHEMGHQFGANHSFNGTLGACGGGNRNGPTAYEPGSASTIMSYAGLCGAEDLQPHSDDYFHAISFDEIVAYTVDGNGNSCPTVTATGNSPPTVEAGPGYTIPQSTPFTLVGSATDPDLDPLTYVWEQFDLGPAAPPDTDDGHRPILRSFDPVTTPARTCPKLADILANTTHMGESLPTTDRTLTFRLTARDDRAGGGGVDWDALVLTVTAASGPFRVTAPGSDEVWSGPGPHSVGWDVASTNLPPVSCSAVDITLSVDGGLSFPYLLASGTANDGSHAVRVVAPDTTSARVRVACTDNIFFDISHADFTLTGAGAAIFSDTFASGDTSAWSLTMP